MTITGPATSPELLALLERARSLPPPTPEEIAAQRRSYVAAEAAMGTDADEAAYSVALDTGDTATLARLDAEADARHARALAQMGDDA
jgi:hypothetical protein